MNEEFAITVQRADEAESRFRSLIANMDRISVGVTEKELNAIVAWLEGEVKKRTPSDTGTLRQSIFSEVHSSGVSLEGLVSTFVGYGPPVEHGRHSNKMPPTEALKGWARRKLGDENAAYAVARAIARRGGFKNHPDGFKMFEEAWKDNAGEVSRMLERIGVHVKREFLETL